MALSKKIITNNANVKNYPFYSESNIFILNDKPLDTLFFEQEYEPIDSNIYEKYTLKNWVKTVFNL